MASDILSKYDNLRKKNFIVELFLWVGGGTSTTIYPYVYLSRSVYKSIHSSQPDPYKISIVLHKEEHIKRIKKIGASKWYRQYFISRKFRLEEELIATKPQLAYIKSKGLTFDLDRKARVLSGHLYFWAVSRNEAKTRLTNMWNSL